MAKLTREAFIKQASLGAATIGALAVTPGLALAGPSSTLAMPDHAADDRHAPLVAHVRDRARGEVAVMVGNREVIVHDHELVRRLVQAVR
jgi:hypothetical protein